MNESANESLALLLDLSGNEPAARRWAAQQFPDQAIQAINKADLKWGSKRQALTRVRQIKPHTLAIFTSDLDLQSARSPMMLFGALSGARRIVLGDRGGRIVSRSQGMAFLTQAPRFFLEVLFGYALLVPLSWVLTFLLRAGLGWRSLKRRIKRRDASPGVAQWATKPPHRTALYIRATLTGAQEGGMVTHVAGFASGAKRLGHGLRFLVSGKPATAPGKDGAQSDNPVYAIRPSATISATRALFELWNNLRFTIKSLNWLREEPGAPFDFIYQRYSRFNWSGVALSVLTGLPLALEFNGSEVWVSQSWDPVGQLALLKRFERLNQRAADLIFTVSAVERRNLIRAGVQANKVFANPNGVDTDKFRARCGGREIRKQFGIDDTLVVGFLGTFGPWHGAPVLAEAATQVKAACHFLFIGDGDQRAASQSKLAAVKERATFTGRIAHEDVAAYLDACDLLVAPHVAAGDGSEFFGSPTKLFEYLAMARPVIASRLGQIAEVIVDGENGLLVEPGDANQLARAIEQLAEDEALRQRLGEAGRKTVSENYTWQHNAARVFDTVASAGLK